jgi:formate dehydrogenase major subunit
MYPAYQNVIDKSAQEKFEKIWNAKLSDTPGLTVTEMIDGAYNGSLKALYVMGENPFLSDPDQHHVEEALRRIDFLIVQDIFLTETAQFADVVLPSACFAEKNGTVTNTERRVQRLKKAVNAPGQAKEDWEIIQGIAQAMVASWHFTSAEEICSEIAVLAPSYSGISWERLEMVNGLQWPCPAPDHAGTPVLHKEKFARGLGLMKAIEYKEPAEAPDKKYPFALTTGRVLEQFHTGTMSRKTAGLNELAGPMVMINTEDAKKLKIKNKQFVRIETRRGAIEAPAFVTDRIGKGTVYIPFHYAEAPANRLTNTAVDQVAKIPEYKICAAKVSKI